LFKKRFCDADKKKKNEYETDYAGHNRNPKSVLAYIYKTSKN